MPNPISRTGDTIGLGGIIFRKPSPNVTVNNRPVELDGCMYSPHVCCGLSIPCAIHCVGTVKALGKNVYVNGQLPITVGAKGTCGHTVGSGSPNVIIK